jgi:LAO/AO transport system kinase
MNIESLMDNLSTENKRVVSRVISLIENDNPNTEEIISKLYKNTGNAYRIGITGPPGAGKSTITNQLAKYYRTLNKTVGIIAIDPTSPFTGGALLGDRVRMSEIGMDDGVFIRSMASRGSLGGLSRKTVDAGDVLDAAGYDYVIYETVGVGQSELDIVEAADSTVVVLVPESGDSIQALKAGLMEIGDIFALNKSDRPGADSALSSLKSMLQLKHHTSADWIPQVLQTIASSNKGIEDINESIIQHRQYLIDSNKLQSNRIKLAKKRIENIVLQKIKLTMKSNDFIYTDYEIEEMLNGVKSPIEIANDILNNLINQRELNVDQQ